MRRPDALGDRRMNQIGGALAANAIVLGPGAGQEHFQPDRHVGREIDHGS
jgi:hypothetical protein